MSKVGVAVLSAAISAVVAAGIAIPVTYLVTINGIPQPVSVEPTPRSNTTPNNIADNSASNVPSGITLPTDDRTLLEPNELGQYFPGNGDAPCTDFVASEPTQEVRYDNPDWGLALEIPYNSDWGNEQYRINPYDEALDTGTSPEDQQQTASLLMGPLVSGIEGCGWVRFPVITFAPQRTAAQATAAIQAEADPIFPLQSIETVTLYNKTAVKYEYTPDALCPGPFYEVIGPKFNYLLNDCFTPQGMPLSEELIVAMDII